VLLLPIAAPWATMLEAVGEFEPGFVMEREQPAQQERDDWAAD
jgi:antitoxin VapB